MKSIKQMTNSELVRKFKALQKQSNKLVDKFINAGLGSLRLSDMRQRINKCPLSNKQIKLFDEMSDIRNEAELRYGPGFMFIDQLGRVKYGKKIKR